MKIPDGPYRGWEIYVHSKDGTAFVEHSVEHTSAKDNQPPTTNVIIQCEDGQEFEVFVSKPCGEDSDNRVDLMTDGRYISGWVFPSHTSFEETFSQSCETVDGQLWMKNLRFDPLQRTDSGAFVDFEKEKQLGTVSITIEKGRTTGPDTWSFPHTAEPPVTILNKTIRPLVTSYVGGKALTRAVKQIRVAWKPATPHRAHNIVFHYYSLQVLVAMEVLPDRTKNNTLAMSSISALEERLEEMESLKSQLTTCQDLIASLMSKVAELETTRSKSSSSKSKASSNKSSATRSWVECSRSGSSEGSDKSKSPSLSLVSSADSETALQ